MALGRQDITRLKYIPNLKSYDMDTRLSSTEETVPISMLKEDEELKSIIPPNNMRNFIEKSIEENGQPIPIEVDSDYVIIDGYTRFQILKEKGYSEVKVRKWNFKSSEDRALAYKLIIMLNVDRRQLKKSTALKLIREIALKIAEEKGKVVSSKIEGASKTSDTNEGVGYSELKEARDELGAQGIVKDWDLRALKKISEIPWLRELVENNEISVKTAYELYRKAKDALLKISSLPEDERRQLVTTRAGRKILIERGDLLKEILDGKITVSEAIAQLTKPREKAIEDGEEELGGEEEEVVGELESESEEGQGEEEFELEEIESGLGQSGTTQSVVKEEEKPRDSLDVLKEKGFVELPTNVVVVKVGGKCYMINEDALHDIQNGFTDKWSDLVEFLTKYGIAVPSEEGTYTIPWKLLGRCVEWK